jgi:dUTP pyrophosphatase
MKVKIKRVDKSLPIPKYHTEGSVGFDLYCRESVEIPPKEFRYVAQNIIIETPKGHALLWIARSGLHKKGLIMLNGVGLFDQDFSGPGDEGKATLYNFTNDIIKVEKGDRLVQCVFVNCSIADFEEVEVIQEKSTHKGMGSTGLK